MYTCTCTCIHLYVHMYMYPSHVHVSMGYDSRMELDKAYEALNDALSSAIDRLAEEHPKTPRNVVMFGSVSYRKLVKINDNSL